VVSALDRFEPLLVLHSGFRRIDLSASFCDTSCSTLKAPQAAENGDMKSWEFLLQKEGDRTWLPLENPTVEILEGRYRVVARTPCPLGEVDIYVSFVSSEDDPPKRRIQQRSHMANDDGLLAILPFTPFRPGRWELRCRPHVAAGDLSQQWHSQIQLQVLPQDASGDDDLFDWDRPQDLATEAVVTGAAATGVVVNNAIAPDAEASAGDALGLDAAVAGGAMDPSPQEALSAAELDPALASDADLQRLADEMSQMVAESARGAGPVPPLDDFALGHATAIDAVEPAGAAGSVGSEPPAVTDSMAEAMAQFGAEGEAETGTGFERESGSGLGRELGLGSGNLSGGNPSVAGAGRLDGLEASGEAAIAIALEETLVVMQGDRQVTIRGQISYPSQTPIATAASLDASLPPELVLTLELRDPGTQEIWASGRESFHPAGPSAIAFTRELQVPLACRTQLLLGLGISSAWIARTSMSWLRSMIC
jgi:hypothetical protein